MFLTYLTIILFSCFSFIGLIGAIKQNIIIKTNKGGHLKHKGKKAIIWGLLVFFEGGFIVFAGLETLLNNGNVNYLGGASLLLVGFFLAFIYAKYHVKTI